MLHLLNSRVTVVVNGARASVSGREMINSIARGSLPVRPASHCPDDQRIGGSGGKSVENRSVGELDNRR